MKFALTSISILLFAAACSTPAPPVNSYCELHQRIDFTDRGILGLNAPNKRAVIVGENTYSRDCLLGDRAKSLGQR